MEGDNMQFNLHGPTTQLLTGLKGIELGAAAHNRFGVDCINVAPEKGWDVEYFKEQQWQMGNAPTPIDLYGCAACIPVEDNNTDFVLSSHVLEHVPNPIAAFLEWQRVIKPGGYVVMIVPQPDALPNDIRSLTTLEELKAAYKRGDTYKDIPIQKGIEVAHFWKFSIDTLKSMLVVLHKGVRGRPGLKWELVGEENPDSKVGNGFWLAYRL